MEDEEEALDRSSRDRLIEALLTLPNSFPAISKQLQPYVIDEFGCSIVLSILILTWCSLHVTNPRAARSLHTLQEGSSSIDT